MKTLSMEQMEKTEGGKTFPEFIIYVGIMSAALSVLSHLD